MNICFLCNEYPPAAMGGIGRFTLTMTRALAAAGHRITVVGLYPQAGGSQPEERDGVRVWRLPRSPAARVGGLMDLLRVARQVQRLYEQGDFDVVEAPDFEVPSVLLPTHIPLVVRLHTPPLLWPRRRTRQAWLMRRAVRRAWRRIAVSEWMGQQVVRLGLVGRRPVEVIPNPVDPLFQPQPWQAGEAAAHVVFAGTLTPHKGLPELMRAWPLVVAALPEARLGIYGKDAVERASGRRYSELMGETLPAECRPTVSWNGHVDTPQLREAYGAAQVCVFPSRTEAFGLVAAEAMACGRPVVFTRHGPGAEVVEHGVSGLLCDPANTAELAGAILTLLQDRALAARMGEAAHRRVEERFSLSVILKRNVGLYESLAGAPPREHGRRARPLMVWRRHSEAAGVTRPRRMP